ncbi:TIGR03621 family F420-dependent LLM class oxidoreductase [Amycolatopsis acidicola]|uniref:TIGR03621 family F420-dependent LLM class oxidoreductase n=1 Tax=Amycolatopsis acidicola TaxID=2596893 RepID=A0A5N0UWF9_9PSEU|nr:TIGR03621 family F420-dependent LLM class oxidoreductase [Amycolatopsis acidicola]KAA9157096.1 TIGR03621 family F420-dependent LLM class oxidoreductase [Amycolatopsis acidicola]
MRAFRFGVSLLSVDDRFVAKCRRLEELGYDVVTVPDHLGAPAPFPALAAAAVATSRLHVGPMVLNVPFYNPVLLARDIESTSAVAGGRFELGVGAGHMKAEFDDAGLPWWPARKRIAYLESTLDELRKRLDPLPPLLIAGHSDGVLSLAAEQADTIGFAGLKQAPGRPPGSFHLAGVDELAERVGFVRERGVDPEFNLLVQRVVVAENPRPELQDWLSRIPDAPQTVDDLLATPQVLAGTVPQIVDTLLERRERFGFSYVTVFEPFLEDFAPVARALSGR